MATGLPCRTRHCRPANAMRCVVVCYGKDLRRSPPGVLAHPSAESDALFETLQEANAHDRVVVMARDRSAFRRAR